MSLVSVGGALSMTASPWDDCRTGIQILWFDSAHRRWFGPAHHRQCVHSLDRLFEVERGGVQMGLPGLDLLHPLKGERQGTWAVSRNWRIMFAFSGPDVVTVEYAEYH